MNAQTCKHKLSLALLLAEAVQPMVCYSGHPKHANSQHLRITSWMRLSKYEHTFQSYSMMVDLLSIFALIHSFVTAAPQERAEEGLNFMLAGVVIGLLPLTLMIVTGLFDLPMFDFPGSDFLFLTLLMIPISFALALLRGTGVSPQPTATGSA